MRTHSRRTWPLYATVAVLTLLGLFVVDGTAGSVILLVALMGLIGASIYALAGEDVKDGAGGIGGGVSF
jgi:hypothetical protein